MLNLQAIRKEKGFSQQQLANRLGVSRSTVAMWETGGSEPDIETLTKLAEIFNVSIDRLLNHESGTTQHVNDDEAMELLDELHKRPEMKALFQVTRKATKEDVEGAVAFVEVLKKKRGDD